MKAGFLGTSIPGAEVAALGDYVQYGAGTCAPDGWLNFDCSPTLVMQRLPLLGGVIRAACSTKFPAGIRYGDIVRGLPVRDQSAQGIYCSHVLEHLSLSDLRIALRNTHRVMTSGGTFRMVLPDLRYIAEKYVGDDSPNAASAFMRETRLGRESRARGVMGLVRTWLGNTEHLWLWDYQSLVQELSDAGFHSFRRAYYQDATDTMFHATEREDRWQDALGIECRA